MCHSVLRTALWGSSIKRFVIAGCW
jgi:hypothetical protein